MDYERQGQSIAGGMRPVDVRAMSAPATVGPGITGQIERLDQVVGQAQGILENMLDILKRADAACTDLCGASEPTPMGPRTDGVSTTVRTEPSTLVSRLAFRAHQIEELLVNIQHVQGTVIDRIMTIRGHL